MKNHALPAFFILWTAGFIAHFDQLSEWFLHPVIAACVALSALAICFPKNLALLVLSLSFQILAFCVQMPLVDNHWLAVAFINLFLLILIGIQFTRDPSTRSVTAETWASAAPVLRILVVLIYGFAVFYKLNSDYFSSDLSCAISFYEKLATLPFLPHPPNLGQGLLRDALPPFIFGWEFGILFFLLWRRTWAIGIFFGISFHLLTSVYLRHFPSVMLPLYLSFIPPEVLQKIGMELERHLSRFCGGLSSTRALQIYSLIWPALFMISALISKLWGIAANDSDLRWIILRLWSLSLLCVFIVGLTLVIRHKLWRLPLESPFRIKRLWHLIFPFLFVVNALSPILGLKTATSFAMWSNLAVKNSTSNHWLFPQGPLHVFPYMKNYLKIVSTNSPSFQEDLNDQTEISLISFHRRLTRLELLNPDRAYSFKVEIDGRRLTLSEVKELDIWRSLDNPFIQKVVWIHDFPATGRGLCRW